MKLKLFWLNCAVILFFTPSMAQPIVWPGDANNNGIVNNIDLLYVGRSFGAAGPARDTFLQGNTWRGDSATLWNNTIWNNVNQVYQDCDGSGMVDNDDTVAIFQNYNRTHGQVLPDPFITPSPGDPTLSFDIDTATTVVPGSTVSISVSYTLNSVIDSGFYGLAFSVLYDTSLVQENTVQTLLDSTFFSPVAFSGYFMGINQPLRGRIDIAITQKEPGQGSAASNFMGQGDILEIIFVMEDNLAGKKPGIEAVFSFVDVFKVTRDFQVTSTNTLSGKVEIDTLTAIVEDPELEINIRQYPNPFNHYFSLDTGPYDVQRITLLDVMGRVVLTDSGKNSNRFTRIDTENLPEGTYLLKVETAKGTVVKRLVKGHY